MSQDTTAEEQELIARGAVRGTPKVEEAIVAFVEPDVRLGSLPTRSPKEVIERATELAKALADVIETQQLFVVIQKRKYVKAEGWLTLGALIGVVPVEEYCRKLEDGKGFEAKIKLIRAKDGGMVGAASAECTYDEKNWQERDSYSLRSMSLTRATGKAFRLSYGWIMKLANYEATPAEEMFEANGSQAQATAVAQRKIASHEAKTGQTSPTVAPVGTSGTPGAVSAMFYTLPNGDQPGSYALIVGPEGMLKLYKDLLLRIGKAQGKGKGVLVPIEKLADLQWHVEQQGFLLKKLEAR